jgi:nicotinate-nucleotide adenylyltransferase
MHLGIYGGTFDPIHLGHLLVARAAIEELALDRLFFVLAAQSPFKPGLLPAPGPLRARMLRLALAGLNRTEVDLQELERGGISYSVDTARCYAARHPESRRFWLIGADHVPSLPRWRDSETLAGLVEFVVIPRPGAEPAVLPPPFRLLELKGFPLAVSSSQIRDRARVGAPLEPLVPPAVSAVIREAGLYRDGPV